MGIVFLIWDFSNPSAKSAARTAPWFGLLLCFIALSRAWAFITSFSICVMVYGGEWGF